MKRIALLAVLMIGAFTGCVPVFHAGRDTDKEAKPFRMEPIWKLREEGKEKQ